MTSFYFCKSTGESVDTFKMHISDILERGGKYGKWFDCMRKNVNHKGKYFETQQKQIQSQITVDTK